jgi:ribosomal protein S18 acetylase RimI-like enzyme
MSIDLDQLRQEAETPSRADAATVDAAAADLSAAFVADPNFLWFGKPGPGYDAARFGFFRDILALLVLERGVIHRPASGGAAACWVPSTAMDEVPLALELALARRVLKLCGLGRAWRFQQTRMAMARYHPKAPPHEYLFFLGVRPDAQGKGLGSRLLKARLSVLDQEGRSAFLETSTPRNLPLYQGHGFEIIHEYRPAPRGPLTWAMWREPRRD